MSVLGPREATSPDHFRVSSLVRITQPFDPFLRVRALPAGPTGTVFRYSQCNAFGVDLPRSVAHRGTKSRCSSAGRCEAKRDAATVWWATGEPGKLRHPDDKSRPGGALLVNYIIGRDRVEPHACVPAAGEGRNRCAPHFVVRAA
jgi:hypothetical protein